MGKNGFTLIELLAVITILAIITLIATPIVLNIIEDSKKAAYKNEVYSIIRAGDLYYHNKQIDGKDFDEEIVQLLEGQTKLDVSTIPGTGEMKITEDGKITLAINNGKYCARKIVDRDEVVITEDIENCILPVTLKEVVTTSEELGITSIDNCMLNGICEPGTAFAIKVNDNETKKFYVINESEDEVTLIMGENTSEKIKWYSSGTNSKGPLVALETLKTDTDNWTNIPLRNYKVIDDGGYDKYEPINISMRTRMLTMTEAIELGCEYQKNNFCPSYLNGNYWLSTAHNSYLYVYSIHGRMLRYYLPYETSYEGIRPVITLVLNKRKTSLINNLEVEVTEAITVPNVEFTVPINIIPTEANNKILKWSSSNTNIVEVSQDGIIIGKSAGTAKVYVETTDGSDVKKEIDVTINSVKKISEIATVSEELEILEVDSCATTGTCEPGTAFAVKVNDNKIYKFYVVSDNGTEITLIMNQNVGSNTNWKKSESVNGPVSVFDVLKEQTADWSNVNLRLYTLSDEAANTYLNVNFYNTRARILSQSEAMTLGCKYNVADSCPSYLTENGSYWLSTSAGGTATVRTIVPSSISWAYATYQKSGVRPVITLSK